MREPAVGPAATTTIKLVVGIAACVRLFFPAGSAAAAPSVDQGGVTANPPSAIPPTTPPPEDAHGTPSVAASPAALPTEPEQTPATEPTAMEPKAKAHYDRGLELYAARQYAASVDELRRAYAIEPHREFLFAQAQAMRLAGDCGAAVAMYRRFMETAPPPLQTQAARLGMDRCGADRLPAATPTAPSLAAPSPPPGAASQPTGPPSGWWHDTLHDTSHDPWAALSIGAGLVALGTAAGFEVASRHAETQAMSRETTTYMEYDRAWGAAQQRRTVAVTALVGGVILLATGGARLMILHGRARPPSTMARPEAKVSLILAPSGAGLMWQGAFP